MRKTALIFGFGGQFGSYMAEFLLSKDYFVVGVLRRRSDDSVKRVEHLLSEDNLKIEHGDILDCASINRLIKLYKPDEIYHAAAQSQVHLSWLEPVHTSQVTGFSIVNLLEAIREFSPGSKLWFAGSSEQFGKVLESPQNEETGFYPRSPYACAKVYAFSMVRVYRESYGLFACSSIMFNNESPRRSPQFVTRKITQAVAQIKVSGGGCIKLGNLLSKRDWSHTKDMVIGAWLMLQKPEPKDYVFASGRTHSIEDFLTLAFSKVDLNWKDYVIQDPALFRPAEVDLLLGDSTKAKLELGWEPQITFEEMVAEMIDNDLKLASK